jgi:RimJ/RimL family protein N-acetyltransferase
MAETIHSVREITPSDIPALTAYWFTADPVFLRGMGVDIQKLPTRSQWVQMLSEQIEAPIKEKQSYCLIWESDGRTVGHSNVRPIFFGEEAYMHLHLWDAGVRKRGMGAELVRMSLPWFFENLRLKRLFSEPYALNPAPNKTLQKVGFDFVKEYITIPGFVNFEQPVKRWELSYEKFKGLK